MRLDEGNMSTNKCCVSSLDDKTIILESPDFKYHLDTSSGLRSAYWQNASSGSKIILSGSELAIDIDCADKRIWICGWRFKCAQEYQTDPDQETGYQSGFYRQHFDDTKWEEMIATSPDHAAGIPNFGKWYTWSRTHAFLPEDINGKEISLTLGGYGLFDYRYMRVFINGKCIGIRLAEKRWNEPAEFEFIPGTELYNNLRFGQDNIIAVQCTGYRNRTKELDELDPESARSLGLKGQRPGHCEQYFTIGKSFYTPDFHFDTRQVLSEGEQAEVIFNLNSNSNLSAKINYKWNSTEPVLHKYISISNTGPVGIRLLNIRLGNYETNVPATDGEQGFPVYLDDRFFIGITHPSGWVIGQDGVVLIKQYPGKILSPGDTFECMESVYGVTEPGKARAGFISCVKSRSRRVLRGHDKPYAILEAFGARSDGEQFWGLGNFDESEDFLLDNISKVAEGQKESGCHFDLYSIDFWVDNNGDLQQADPIRFPNGLTPVLKEIKKLGTNPGLWIDSSMPEWTIGGNPVVRPTHTFDPAHATDRPTLCRATDPIKTIYSTAFRHHIRENGARMIKFDNLQSICYNTNHEHLPGIYSTEAIQSCVIETLRNLDQECPDVFLMLYWGYRSPWWLLHADTLFEPGIAVEAAHPADKPTLYVRDSVTVGLDQAHWFCKDVPTLGKDSLGVWLSDWKWNSSIGKERWQEAFVMDICRGSLLAQPWSDKNWLTPPEREQMAEFIALLKANPECFSNPRFVIGNPWKNEPYGYCCTDGERAFVAINNCVWSDTDIKLELNENWGLDANKQWDIYRWYPNKARLAGESDSYTDNALISLRPFEVVLLEVAEKGSSPSLTSEFDVLPISTAFPEPTCTIPIAVKPLTEENTLVLPEQADVTDDSAVVPCRTANLSGTVPVSSNGGYLILTTEVSSDGKATMQYEGKDFAAKITVDRHDVLAEPVVRNDTYTVCWQAWRIPVEIADSNKSFNAMVSVPASNSLEIAFKAYFIPS